ncbi:MAG: 2Fe-2S iron-sulfur cluster binding domain-containing protein [Flavobacteriales bacterium]|nr:2Fe-2S iron-sulfur cluster binding domain-containing protein [Flavobacteriales bacterium]
MPSGFFKLKVDKITRETTEAVSIRLLIPPPLKAMFQYKAGQYLTLHAMLNGEDVRRSYSVCSSPFLDEMPTVAVKQVSNGKMSTFLNKDLKEGDLIDAMPPMGKFSVEPNENAQKLYMLYGGGSGVTPVKSIALTVLNKEPKSRVVLVYANKNEDSIIFKNEFDQLETEFLGRLKIIHSLDNPPANWSGLSGMLNAEKIIDIVNKNAVQSVVTEHFICGPTGMMKMIEDTLKQMNVKAEHIHLEYFTAIVKEKPESETVEFTGESKVKISVFGQEKTVSVKPNQTILEAAQDAGLDPPYSCTVGVCTTCRAKVYKGEVKMDEREGLSDAEIDEGFVLTCQSHPVSPEVELKYE